MSEDTERPVSSAAPPGSVPAQRPARQRRPTGAPPPLPHPVRVSTTAGLVLAVVIVACAFLFSEYTPWLRSGDRASSWILRQLAEARTPWLTDAEFMPRAVLVHYVRDQEGLALCGRGAPCPG